MNKFYAILILCLLPFGAKATQVIFKGKIMNPSYDLVEIVFVQNELLMENVVFKTKLNPENDFNISIDVQKEQIIKLRYGLSEIEMFVTPFSGTIKMQFESYDPEKTVFFIGDNSHDNNFLKTFNASYLNKLERTKLYHNGYLTTIIDEEVASIAMSYGISDYFKYVDRKLQDQRMYLDNNPRLSRFFRDYIRAKMYWQYEVNKLAYFLLNKDYIPVKKLSTYWTQYALMQSVDIRDDKRLQYEGYQNLLTAFLHYLQLESPDGNDKDDDLDFYQFIDKNLADRIRYFMQAKLMINAFRQGQADLAQRKFKGFKKFNPHREYTETVEMLFGSQLEFVATEYVPDFDFVDLGNVQRRLSDYRGKVVYVSLWASWCAPCLKGFKETNAVRRELQSQGVVFLNVNVDKEQSAWHRVLGSRTLEGTNVYVKNLGDFQSKLGFSGLPYYALVDKFGRLNYLSTDDLNTSRDDFRALLSQ